MMNKRGNFMVGILVAIMSLFLFLALVPAIVQMFGMSKGSDSANCPGYVDPAGYYSYNASRSTNTLTCTVLDFSPGLIVVGVVFSIIIGIITGRLGQQEQQQQQQYQYSYQ